MRKGKQQLSWFEGGMSRLGPKKEDWEFTPLHPGHGGLDDYEIQLRYDPKWSQ